MKNGNFYIGSTTNLSRRIAEHKSGHTLTTYRHGVDSLVLSQEYSSLKRARSVERKLKALKRRDYIEKIIQDGYIRVRP